MSRTTKIWLIIAALLVIVGAAIFAWAMTEHNWDFTKLSSVEYKTSAYEFNEKFNRISLKTDTAEIRFIPSDEGVCRVVCYENERVCHKVRLQDGTLTVSQVDNRKWYEYIGINIGTPSITVYLPDREYESLYIDESTGGITIPKDFTFGSIDITASTGSVKCSASAPNCAK